MFDDLVDDIMFEPWVEEDKQSTQHEPVPHDAGHSVSSSPDAGHSDKTEGGHYSSQETKKSPQEKEKNSVRTSQVGESNIVL